MKKITIVLVSILMAGTVSLNAQSTTKKAETDVKNGTKKAADKTAEVASNGKATVVDKVYKDKEGPDGQTIYIDGHSKYYWIDKKGHRVYATKNELKSKH